MRALINASFARNAVPRASQEAIGFHRSLSGYVPTPVRQLPAVAIAIELGVGAVQVKDESDRLGLPSFKILGASWAIERTLRERPSIDTLVAASAGNHGRAVARCAAQRGLRCEVYLPQRARQARRRAIAAEGAEVTIADGNYERAVELAERAGTRDRTAVIADVGSDGPSAWVIDGYATLFTEAADQAAYDLIVVPVGVGSLAAAAARHGAQIDAAVIGVEPATAACLTASLAQRTPTSVSTPGTAMAGLDCAQVSAAAWPTLSRGIAGSITVSDEEATAAVAALAACGLTIGESGAAPLAGLRALMRDGACRALRAHLEINAQTRVLLVATEGSTGTAHSQAPTPTFGLER